MPTFILRWYLESRVKFVTFDIVYYTPLLAFFSLRDGILGEKVKVCVFHRTIAVFEIQFKLSCIE